jgi:hypothetical protein
VLRKGGEGMDLRTPSTTGHCKKEGCSLRQLQQGKLVERGKGWSG